MHLQVTSMKWHSISSAFHSLARAVECVCAGNNACCWLQIEGNLIKWEKWHIRTSFNYREGLVLHNVG
jgi:Cu2+-containing amine oxidase